MMFFSAAIYHNLTRRSEVLELTLEEVVLLHGVNDNQVSALALTVVSGPLPGGRIPLEQVTTGSLGLPTLLTRGI